MTGGRSRISLQLSVVPDPTRILLIRPSALGDVCRSVPLLVSLRRAFPDAQIDWLVQDSFADAVSAHPDLNAVVPFARGSLGRSLRKGRPKSLLAMVNQLRQSRYDLVIDAQGLFRSGFFAWASRAPRRVGDTASRELGWLFLNERFRSDHLHTVDRMLDVLQQAGIPAVPDLRLYTTPKWQEAAHALLGDTHPIVLAPTSRWKAKRWPADRWAVAADRLLALGHGPVVIVGSPGEQSQCVPLLERSRHRDDMIDLVGQTSIGVLMAVIERAKLVIANDSAALHMAVGMRRPIVALYGPTDVSRVGPYGHDDDVLQHVAQDESLDHKNEDNAALMDRISVDEVVSAAERRLSRASARTLA
jgi:heptosyltransferase I